MEFDDLEKSIQKLAGGADNVIRRELRDNILNLRVKDRSIVNTHLLSELEEIVSVKLVQNRLRIQLLKKYAMEEITMAGNEKFSQLAKTIIENVGGSVNVTNLTHCTTRLRFNLKDENLANTSVLENTVGILGITQSGGQYQVIIGNDVARVFTAINDQENFTSQNVSDDSGKNKNVIVRVLDTLAGIFTPILPAMIGCAMIKAVLIILKTFNLIDLEGQLYQILTFAGDSAYYFMPMLLAWSAASKFKTNVGLALVLAGFLLHPTFSTMLSSGDRISLLGLPVTNATYSSSVLPIILSVWVLSYVEKFAENIVPNVVKSIFKPLLIILIMLPLTLVVLGPIGAIAGNYLASAVSFINEHAGWLVSAIIGAAFPFLIMTGMHYSLGPVVMTAYAATGTDGIVGPGMLVHSFTQSGAALAVALKTKNLSLKQVAFSTSLTAALGVTEPAMFGVNLKLRKPLYAVVIAGAVAGCYVGLFGVARSALGITGLLTFPAFITENPMSIVHAIIGSLLGFVVAFLLTFVFGFEDLDEVDKESTSDSSSNELTKVQNNLVSSPLKGKVLNLESIKDVTFASGAVGQGIAIEPEEGIVKAPFDGIVSAVFPSHHAIGLKSSDGIEVLIHVGMDTVELNGQYFEEVAKEGQKVSAGDLLLKFDLDQIKALGYEVTTPVVFTNKEQYNSLQFTNKTFVDYGDLLLTLD